MTDRSSRAVILIMLVFGVAAAAIAEEPTEACVLRTVTGVCNGVGGYPVRFDPTAPNGVSALCPPYHDPLVVFAPHPDDETLAMAGIMREAKDQGRQVIVELMTNGDQSAFCGEQGPQGVCSQNRCEEFMTAMQALGVDGVTVNNFGDKTLLTGGGSACPPPNNIPPPVASKVPQRVQFWTSMSGTSAIVGCLSLRGTAGVEDHNGCHADHTAVRVALQNANYPDTKWYSVYEHSASDRFTTPAFAHEAITPARCNGGVVQALSAYKYPSPPKTTTNIGYSGASGAFDAELSDCSAGSAEELALSDPFTSCFTSGGSCPEGSCVNPDGEYISHFTGSNCDGTESYYLPYDGYAYQCRPDPSSGAVCGTVHRTVTNRSYRYQGQCYADAWPGGNTLSDFVTVYRTPPSGGCGEPSCVNPDGQYISHFTGSNCDGTESYYLPYDGYAYQCRPDPSSGAVCGTIHRTVTNRSYRYQGQCSADAWPDGNTLSDFVTVYH